MQPAPPCSAPACWWWLWVLGVAIRHVTCGFCFCFFFFFFGYLFIYFSSQLCCPLRFRNSPQTNGWECFLVFENFSSFKTSFPGQISVPTSFVSPFIFYIFVLPPLKIIGCLSECLMSSTSVQKLFCRICSAYKWSLDEFVEEKVVSLFYSSTILWPRPLYY